MREILFRGKRLDNGEWVLGYFCEFANNRTGEQESYIQTVKQDGRIDLIHKVDPSAVGQYTGLKDKNGKQIFEGDVLEVNYDRFYVGAKGCVKFECGSYMIDGISGVLSLYVYLPYCKVIGNIHDNPELLGGGDSDV